MSVHERPSGLTLAERFWSHVDRSGDCWIWLGGHGCGGRYGSFRVGAKMRPAHVVAYELDIGPVPPGLELDHICRNRLCVRPAHLEPVTHRENVLRGCGLAADNARRTRCVRGHFLPRRTVGVRKPTRVCRHCANQRNRDYRTRLAA